MIYWSLILTIHTQCLSTAVYVFIKTLSGNTEETSTYATLGVNNSDFIINDDKEAEFSKSKTQPTLHLSSKLNFWVFVNKIK